jgi:hypothetical protein
MRSADRLVPAALPDGQNDAVSVMAGRHGVGAFQDGDVLAPKQPAQDFDQLRLVARQDGGLLDDGDGHTEPTMRHRHLDADGTSAHDQEMARLLPQGEDRFVREDVAGGQPRHRGNGRARSGCYDDSVGADGVVAGPQRATVDERSTAPQHPYAEPFEALHGILRGNGGHDIEDALFYRREVDAGRRAGDAGDAVPAIVRSLAGGQQGFRGHASGVEALAAHRGMLDQDGPQTELTEARRD